MTVGIVVFTFRLDVSDVLKKLLSSLLHIAYSIPTTNSYTIYLTSSKEMRHVAEKFIVGSFYN